MTLTDPVTQAAFERLWSLVPVHDRARDEAAGGTVAALIRAVATELAVLETDLDRLSDAWFIETCEEWLVPYLADLVGLREVPPDLGASVSRRALVANTVVYRRRKGTVAVLEQVARDVTGWPSRAVEHHPLLVTTAHTRHVRLDRPGLTSLRAADALELGSVVSPPGPRGVLDGLRRTAEVRRIVSRRGRWNIRNVGVFVVGVQAYPVGAPDVRPEPVTTRGGWSQAREGDDATVDGYTFDPLGRLAPLLAAGQAEAEIEHLAGEADLPVPLRPRRLLSLLAQARANGAEPASLPIGVRVDDDEDLPPDRIRVCRLEDLGGADPQVMVDTITGRLWVYRAGVRVAADRVTVRYGYGGVADIGAGTYDRVGEHEQVLLGDRWTGADGVAAADGPPAGAQVHVVADPADPAVSAGAVTTVAGALGIVQAEWADAASEGLGRTSVVSVGDCAGYPGDLEVAVPEATRLVVVAATWPRRVLPDGEIRPPEPGRYVPDGLRPHLRGDLHVTGAAGSSVVLDGLVVEGDVVVGPGDLGSLTVSQCTVTGQVRVESGEGPDAPAGNATLSLRVHRSVVGGVAGAEVPSCTVTASVVDAVAELAPGSPGTGVAVDLPGQVCVEGSTVRGDLVARTLDASSAVLDGVVTVTHRQVGCVRFSYVGPGSTTPRRFRCVGADGASTTRTPAPAYASVDPASAAYLALDGSCHPAIRAGGEGESEMGVHHHLRRPLRLSAARRQLEPYVPAGIEIQIFGS